MTEREIPMQDADSSHLTGAQRGTVQTALDDRALLELAAKAHGYVDDAIDNSAAFGLHKSTDGEFYWIDGNGWTPWVPGDDDGQALRLAVKLRIHLKFARPGHAKDADRVQASPMGLGHLAYVAMFEDDDAAATRQAIVRAAADIGRERYSRSATAK